MSQETTPNGPEHEGATAEAKAPPVKAEPPSEPPTNIYVPPVSLPKSNVPAAQPDAKVVLLDSIQKKAEFLKESVAAMKLKNASAFGERAEDHLVKHHYDVVVMRAVSSVRENVRTLRKVRHSLRDLVMLKGPSWSREVKAGEREAERLGFKLDTVWEYALPEETGKRAVLVYRAPGGQGR